MPFLKLPLWSPKWHPCDPKSSSVIFYLFWQLAIPDLYKAFLPFTVWSWCSPLLSRDLWVAAHWLSWGTFWDWFSPSELEEIRSEAYSTEMQSGKRLVWETDQESSGCSFKNRTFSFGVGYWALLSVLSFIFQLNKMWVELQHGLSQLVSGFQKATAPHSSTLAWNIPWTEEPGGLQSMGSLGVGHDRATSLSLFPFMHWRRKWQPTPVFLPGESQGWGSLVGCRLWGCTELDTTEAT